MKLYIPEIGDKLRLLKEWDFILYSESRNEALYTASTYNHNWQESVYYGKHDADALVYCWLREENSCDYYKMHSLPPGTELTIDRLYIRKGAAEFSSVSFFLNRKSVNPHYSRFAKRLHEMKGRCRFWVKLKDANKIEFEQI